jgi:CheY-like chemotaxis protein
MPRLGGFRSADSNSFAIQSRFLWRPGESLQPRKVLVVDDSKLMHKMYEVMLRQYPLVYASDGRQALDRLQEHADIDLVLLDINMPNMNGLEFLAQIRSNGAHKDLAVIIISTEGRDEDTQRGLEAGASAYIKKPFHSEDILEKISQL